MSADFEAAPTSTRGRSAGRIAATVVRHLLGACATLIAVSVITFAATNIKSPTDIARNALGRFVGPALLASYVRRHGLDRPVYERYVTWFADYIEGDWGVSPVTDEPVEPLVLTRVKRTAIIAIASLLLSTPLGIAIGAYAARHPGRRRDFVVVLGSIVITALPEFVIAIVLLLVFGVELRVLPADSTAISFGGFWPQAEDYVLPTLTLVLAMLPYVTRMARSAFVEAYRAPYIQAALLRGLPRRTVIWRHALPNAGVSLVNVIAQNLIYVFGGVVVVETVFGLPGIGSTLVQSIGSGDVITVQAIAMLTGIIFVGANLLADVAVFALNPRLRQRP